MILRISTGWTNTGMTPDYSWNRDRTFFVAINLAKIAAALLHAPGTGLSVNLSWILGRAYCVAYWTKVQ